MKYKILIFNSILLLSLELTTILAQNNLLVNEHFGMQSSFLLNNIRKLTFTSGNISFSLLKGDMRVFALNNISNLRFNTMANNVIPRQSLDANNSKLYPNPVTEKLQIKYELTKPENVLLEIVNLQGKLIYQNNSISKVGINITTISVDKLPG